MTRKYLKHTKETLAPIVAESISYSECLHKMGLVVAGGNYKHLQRNIDKFHLDTSHMKHQAHNSGKELIKFDDLTKPASIKNRVIKERGNACERCGLFSWMDAPITLELDHIDGNNRNNVRENLKLLCPNCHSQTPTWRGRRLKNLQK